jgi:hypothetical protein
LTPKLSISIEKAKNQRNYKLDHQSLENPNNLQTKKKIKNQKKKEKETPLLLIKPLETEQKKSPLNLPASTPKLMKQTSLEIFKISVQFWKSLVQHQEVTSLLPIPIPVPLSQRLELTQAHMKSTQEHYKRMESLDQTLNQESLGDQRSNQIGLHTLGNCQQSQSP